MQFMFYLLPISHAFISIEPKPPEDELLFISMPSQRNFSSHRQTPAEQPSSLPTHCTRLLLMDSISMLMCEPALPALCCLVERCTQNHKQLEKLLTPNYYRHLPTTDKYGGGTTASPGTGTGFSGYYSVLVPRQK